VHQVFEHVSIVGELTRELRKGLTADAATVVARRTPGQLDPRN
jgi:hypothetical protein